MTVGLCSVKFHNTILQGPSSRAREICRHVGKPTAEHASIMRSLFPSSSACSSKRPRMTSSFDPTQQCVVATQHQKKKSSRCKPSKVTIIVVSDHKKGVPKGNSRKELQKSGRISKLEFNRKMSALQVKGVVIRGFQHINLTNFLFLKCCQTNSTHLLPDSNQNPDGLTLIESSRSGKSVVYITDSPSFEV